MEVEADKGWQRRSRRNNNQGSYWINAKVKMSVFMLLSPALVINKNESTCIKGLGTLNVVFSFFVCLF